MQYDPNAVVDSRITCITCGYDLSGSPLGGVCPECGTPVHESLPLSRAGSSASTSGTAVTCMILGIISIVSGCGIIGPIAVWLYYRHLDEARRGQSDSTSMAMAKAGMICGWIGFFLVFCFCGFWSLLVVLDM